jgi:dipeptidyl aminopeptidase/acylaminoacyl peptidase
MPALALLLVPNLGLQGVRVLSRSVYPIPSWTAAVESTDVERYATADEYAAAASDARYVLEKLRYRSEGLSVIAYLYRPTDDTQTKRPVIVFNRGSYVRGDIAPELLPMFHRLANAGFSIVAPMYRGSDGGEGHDEMGGADLHDLMNVAELLSELPSLDTRNVFLYGESRGGMMVFQAMRDGFPARAAATFGGFTDLEALVSTEDGMAMARSIWPRFDEERDEIIARRSAIHWPDRLDLPLLLMHGSDDESVSPVQTLLLARELADANKELGVIIFPGGSHTLTQQRVERDQHAVEFFRMYRVE